MAKRLGLRPIGGSLQRSYILPSWAGGGCAPSQDLISSALYLHKRGCHRIHIISPANNGQAGHVSLQASNYPNHFLRHANYRFLLNPADPSSLYRDESTFRVVPALNGNPACVLVSFLSYNFSRERGKENHYICVKQDARDQVWLSTVNVSDMRDVDRACWAVNHPMA